MTKGLDYLHLVLLHAKVGGCCTGTTRYEHAQDSIQPGLNAVPKAADAWRMLVYSGLVPVVTYPSHSLIKLFHPSFYDDFS